MCGSLSLLAIVFSYCPPYPLDWLAVLSLRGAHCGLFGFALFISTAASSVLRSLFVL